MTELYRPSAGTHPITPPPELVEEWREEWEALPQRYPGTCQFRYVATQAAQWGADMELEACCKWLPKLPPWSADDLRRHRRPKPPSLKEQALALLDKAENPSWDINEYSIIRRALEALDD